MLFILTSLKLLTLSLIAVVLIDKLMKYKLQKQMVRWTENCLKCQVQRDVTSGTKSSWRTVTRGVLHRSILEPVLFSIFIHNPKDGTEYTLSMFSNDTKLEEMTDAPGMCAASQRNLDRLKNLSKRNLTKLSKMEMQSPAPGEEKSHVPAHTGEPQGGSQLYKERPGVLVSKKLKWSQ